MGRRCCISRNPLSRITQLRALLRGKGWKMIAEFLIAASLMGGLGVILAIVLAIADKKFYVWEDPRIDEVEAMLPLANCGACGCPGCRAFAEKASPRESQRSLSSSW
jgi:hypothetical protein